MPYPTVNEECIRAAMIDEALALLSIQT